MTRVMLGVIVITCLQSFNMDSNKVYGLLDHKKDLINEYYFLKNIDGRHNETIEFNSIMALSEEQLVNLNYEICSNIRCNYMYSALSHVYLCKSLFTEYPATLANFSQLLGFHRWAKQMLVTMYNVPRLKSAISVMWIFYLFTYRLEMSLARDAIADDETIAVILDVHDETLEIFFLQMQIDCPAIHERNKGWRDFKSYIRDIMAGEKSISTPSKMLRNSTRAFGQFRSNISNGMTIDGIEFFGVDRLYLNNVVENFETMKTLTTEFRLMTDGHPLSSYLVSTFKAVKDPKSTLQQQASALYAVHFNFIAMLKIMVLRIHSKHLTYLKRLDNSEIKSAYNTKMNARLKEFASLLNLKKDDEIKLYFDQHPANSEIKDSLDDEYINGAQSDGSALLKQLCNSLQVKISCLEASSIILSTPELQRIAVEYKLNIPNEVIYYSVQKSVLCADVFVKYIGQILSGIDFEVIYSFMATQFSQNTLTEIAMFM